MAEVEDKETFFTEIVETFEGLGITLRDLLGRYRVLVDQGGMPAEARNIHDEIGTALTGHDAAVEKLKNVVPAPIPATVTAAGPTPPPAEPVPPPVDHGEEQPF